MSKLISWASRKAWFIYRWWEKRHTHSLKTVSRMTNMWSLSTYAASKHKHKPNESQNQSFHILNISHHLMQREQVTWTHTHPTRLICLPLNQSFRPSNQPIALFVTHRCSHVERVFISLCLWGIIKCKMNCQRE